MMKEGLRVQNKRGQHVRGFDKPKAQLFVLKSVAQSYYNFRNYICFWILEPSWGAQV